MKQAALILHAGQSGLAFKIYLRKPGETWHCTYNGEAEEQGPRSRFRAFDEQGTLVADQEIRAMSTFGVRKGLVLEALIDWLEEREAKCTLVGVAHCLPEGAHILGRDPFMLDAASTHRIVEQLPAATGPGLRNLDAIQSLAAVRPFMPQFAFPACQIEEETRQLSLAFPEAA
jgi:hypothetical protein